MKIKTFFTLFLLSFFFSFPGISHAAFTLTVNGSGEVTATVTGGTEASPNLASELADQIIADANPNINSKAFRSENLMWFRQLRIVQNRDSWFKWDDDALIELRDSFRSQPQNESAPGANDGPGIIFGLRSVLHLIEDSSVGGFIRINDGQVNPILDGGTLIALRDLQGVNPLIIKSGNRRNDYPTFNTNITPARVILEGLSYKLLGNSSSQKWYFGNSRNANGDDRIENLQLSGGGEIFQTYNTTYENPSVPAWTVAGETAKSNVYINNAAFGTDGGASNAFSGTFRGGKYTVTDPVFPKNPWDTGNQNGIISPFTNDNSYFQVRFTNTLNVTDGVNPISDARVHWSQSVLAAGSGYDTSALVDNAQDPIIDIITSGVPVSQTLIDTLRARGTAGVAGDGTTERYQYTLQVRHYDYLSSRFTYQNREFAVTENRTNNIIMTNDLSLSSTEAAAQALTVVSNLDELYDLVKERWVNDGTWDTDQYAVANGGDLDFGNWNIVIDPTAPAIFNRDDASNTITIKSTTLSDGDIFTSFTTTGTVSYQNAAIQDTDYTDTTGFNPVDNTDPSITITSQVPTKIDNQGITIDIQATDDRAITLDDVHVSLANTTAGVANFICTQTSSTQVDCTLEVLSSGNVEIRAEDVRGLSTVELDLNYIIDTEAPIITAALDTSAPFSTSSPEVTFSATDNISASGDIDFTVSVDDGPFITQSSPYTPALVGDRHIIVIRAADELNNQREFSFVYTPLLTITAPTTTSNTDITDTTISVASINDLTNVTITGAGSTFICAPDPTPASPSSGPVTCSGAITTTGTLAISATDTLITDNADLGYVIERTPPVITITAPTTTGTDGITDTTISVVDDVAVNANDVFIDGSSSSAARLFNCTQTSTTQVDCTIDVASSGDLVILARDRSDNESMEMQSYTVIPAGFSRASNGGGGSGGGSHSILLCTSDPTAANYYNGDLDEFRFYKVVNRCVYGNNFSTDLAATLPHSAVEISYEKPQCTINYSRLVKRGLHGNDVRQVQRCMNSLGYTSGPEDGIYGSLTYAGITAYQRAHNLKYIDGIVGPETSGSLNDLGDVTVKGI